MSIAAFIGLVSSGRCGSCRVRHAPPSRIGGDRLSSEADSRPARHHSPASPKTVSTNPASRNIPAAIRSSIKGRARSIWRFSFERRTTPERSDDRDSVSHSTTPSGSIIENRPSRNAESVCDNLRLTEPEIPVLYARGDRDALDSVSLCPFQRGGRSPVLVLTCADLLDDGVRNQDCGSEALDQVEPGDAGE